jgi:hypothetical protein
MILPNNDDGDLTYYKRRSREETLPLIGGTGQVTQAAARPAGSARPAGRVGGPAGRGAALPAGFSANPVADPGPSGFPVIQMTEGGIPAALGMPNTNVQNILAAEQSGAPRPAGGDVFQAEWIDACKGRNSSVTHGTSSKTHCDFDYSGTMIEQMLLGLVAHRVGKKISYDPTTGRVTNAPEANDYLKRTYRSGWTLNG